MSTEKDLTYWKANAEEDYKQVPISVLRYITELEKAINCDHEWVKPIINAENKKCCKCGVWEEKAINYTYCCKSDSEQLPSFLYKSGDGLYFKHKEDTDVINQWNEYLKTR